MQPINLLQPEVMASILESRMPMTLLGSLSRFSVVGEEMASWIHIIENDDLSLS
jgi:hypothetical protein